MQHVVHQVFVKKIVTVEFYKNNGNKREVRITQWITLIWRLFFVEKMKKVLWNLCELLLQGRERHSGWALYDRFVRICVLVQDWMEQELEKKDPKRKIDNIQIRLVFLNNLRLIQFRNVNRSTRNSARWHPYKLTFA